MSSIHNLKGCFSISFHNDMSFLKNLICIEVSIHKRHCCVWGRRISKHWNLCKVAHIVWSVLLQSCLTIQTLLHQNKKSETLFPSSEVFSYIKSHTMRITNPVLLLNVTGKILHYRQNIMCLHENLQNVSLVWFSAIKSSIFKYLICIQLSQYTQN